MVKHDFLMKFTDRINNTITQKILAFLKANWQCVGMLVAIFVNIAYMHYVAAPREYVGKWIIPIEMMLFDTFVLVAIVGLISLLRLKIAYIVSFSISLLWSFINVVYFRCFEQYMPVSAFMETSNLAGTWWIEYVVGSVRTTDIVYLVGIIFFVFCLKQTTRKTMNWKVYLALPVLIIACHFATYTIKNKSISGYFPNNYGAGFISGYDFDMERQVLYAGIFRSHVYCNICKLSKNSSYSDKEKEEMRQLMSGLVEKNKTRNVYENSSVGKNVVIIIVESYLSASSDLKIGEYEITPNLNALKHTDGVYFNGNMRQNIAKGESSDGQFIAMTGLLPLKNDLTVVKILKNKIPAFPAIMRDSCGYSTHITVPTRPTFWHQQDVNKVYGIDSLYSVVTGNNFTTDEEIMRFSYEKEKQMQEPYLHIILTASMHGGYDVLRKGVPNFGISFPDNYSQQYKNYLNTCHYTDSVLGEYFQKKKDDDTFENTVFVIMADHEAHKQYLNIDDSIANDYKLPLYIVNAAVTPDTNCVTSDINQTDIFPTLLDLIGSDSEWRGLGHSVFDKEHYVLEISPETEALSEYIIREDAFRKLAITKEP